MGSLKGLLFSGIVSDCIRGFENVGEDSGWKSLEEKVGGFSISLGVSSLSGIFLKVSDVLCDVGPPHLTAFECNSSLLLFVWVLKLGFKFIKELCPYDWEVILNSVESIDPNSHVSNPSSNLISFDKGEGEGNFLNW